MAIVIVFLAGVQLTIHDTRNWIYYTDTAGFSQEAADTIRAFELGFGMGSSCTGIGCQPNKQWARHRWLLSNLTNEEFSRLYRSYHAKTNAVAYEGLIRNNRKNAYRLLFSASSRKELVHQTQGCFGRRITVAEYVLSKTIGTPNGIPMPPANLIALELDKKKRDMIWDNYQQAIYNDN